VSKKTGLDGALATLADSVDATKAECTVIKGRNSANIDMSQDVVNAPDFESMGFQEKFQGLRDASGSIGGFHDPADTTGLKVIFEAWYEGTKKGLKLWTDDTHYVYAEVLFTGPALDIPLEDMQSSDIDFEVSNMEKEWLLAAFDDS